MLRVDELGSRPTRAAALTLGALLVALAAAPASAQEATADSVVQQGEVEYQRETFTYPQRERNPFEPVSAGVQEGPRFQNLVLAGLIYSPSVGSVAVLVDQTNGRRYRVREGERIGQATVLSIRQSDVVFSVSGPTRTRQETLQVEKQTEEEVQR